MVSFNKMEKIWERTSLRRVEWARNQAYYNEYIKFEMLMRHLGRNTKVKCLLEQKILKWGSDLSLINMYYKALPHNTKPNLITGLPKKNIKSLFLIHFWSEKR